MGVIRSTSQAEGHPWTGAGSSRLIVPGLALCHAYSVLAADEVSVPDLQNGTADVAQAGFGVRGHGVDLLAAPVRVGEVGQ